MPIPPQRRMWRSLSLLRLLLLLRFLLLLLCDLLLDLCESLLDLWRSPSCDRLLLRFLSLLCLRLSRSPPLLLPSRCLLLLFLLFLWLLCFL